jgi:hypothetical protein
MRDGVVDKLHLLHAGKVLVPGPDLLTRGSKQLKEHKLSLYMHREDNGRPKAYIDIEKWLERLTAKSRVQLQHNPTQVAEEALFNI